MKKNRNGRNLNRVVALCLLCTVLFSNSFVCVHADEKQENQQISQEEKTETAETNQAETEKQEPEKAAPENQESENQIEKTEPNKSEAETAAPEKEAQEKQEADKKDAANQAPEKQDDKKAQEEVKPEQKIEEKADKPEKTETEKTEADKKAEAEKKEAEKKKAEAEKKEAEKKEAEKKEAEKKEAEKKEAEKKKAEEQKQKEKKKALEEIGPMESEGNGYYFSRTVKNGYGDDYTWIQDGKHVWYSKPIHDNRDLIVNFKGRSSHAVENPRLITLDSKGNPTDADVITPSESSSEKMTEDNEIYYANDYSFQIDTNKEGTHYYRLDFGMQGESFHSERVIVRIDNTAPSLDLGCKADNQEYAPYYSCDVELVAKINEWNLKEGNIRVIVPGESGSDENNFEITDKDRVGKSKNKYEIRATYSASGKYVVIGELRDKAGNELVLGHTEEAPSFVIDKEAPKVTVAYDNNSPKNKKYYNTDRVAKITVTDENINQDNLTTQGFTCDGIEKATVGAISTSDKDNTFDITFNQDGTYCFKDFSFIDLAGNKCELENADTVYSEFVIDKTAPVVEVNFDNTNYENDKYFNNSRTATIDIKEASFSNDLVKLNVLKGTDALPKTSDYTENGDSHQTTIKFDKDGTYGFTIKLEDLAGNVSEEYTSNEFVIDTKEPELEITGVEDMSANNGSVNPVITVKDPNLRDNLIDISFFGAKHGLMSPPTEMKLGKEMVTYTILDLPNNKDSDDFYTLNVEIKDLAGNIAQQSLSYSINRYGSVYILGAETTAMVNGYYVTKPQKVVITENNVDEISSREVSVTCDGNVKILQEGKGYQVSEVNSDGNHSVTYTINKSNFEKDGFYSVAVYSEDKASNKQSNQTKNAKVEFMVDTTAPTLLVADLEEGERYDEAEHEFTVNVTDTIGVSKLDVYLDSKKEATFSNADLAETGGTVKVTIPEKEETQAVVLVSTDYAGNETRLSYNVIVSMKAEKIELKSKVTPNAGDDYDAIAKLKQGKMGWLGVAVLGLLTVIVAVATALFIRKKDKKN
ncbi:cell envelope integrity protein TolA [Pseudobutyrivibrio sp. YE44]|uniref:cell envelope integrity protein TolA n=1 Tax=Pseudobutyrivibrio sp. YE44 TaxID=1520802 RepID=UPI000B89E8D7|nr:cell envelope integrity protein TolA [Pseudobutyrivibrio sp. YE44]